MNDNILKIRTLVNRFFDGDTTLSEEQQLYDFFAQELAALPDDLKPLRQMFLDLAAVQHVAENMPQPAVQKPLHASNRRRWVVAAAVAVLLAGGALTLFMRNAQTEADEEYVAYIYGQRTTDRTVVLDEMQKTMTAMVSTDGADVVEEQLKSMFSN